ncbi:MAG: YihY/virulence factor BrkB family protein, partial [Gammaproteobacteria bacterium]|nr:YihY/virulence factor BrkB family protein [Gammaproteobacteria bacterium]
MRTLLPGRWVAALEGQLFRPRSVTGIRGLPLRFLRHTWAIARELIAGRLTQRAEGLVYMTILSVVPLLALSFSLLKAFELHRQVEPLLREWLAPLGPRSEVILETVMGLVDNTRGTILAGLGIVLLLYTAMSMARRVEDSLNFVWQVSHPRAFARRLRDQLAAILLGPVVMAVGMALIAWLARSAARSDLAALAPVIPVLPVSTRAAPWLLVCAAFSFAYWYIPNTRVQPRAALAGAAV